MGLGELQRLARDRCPGVQAEGSVGQMRGVAEPSAHVESGEAGWGTSLGLRLHICNEGMVPLVPQCHHEEQSLLWSLHPNALLYAGPRSQ